MYPSPFPGLMLTLPSPGGGTWCLVCSRTAYVLVQYATGNKKSAGCSILCSCAVRFAAVVIPCKTAARGKPITFLILFPFVTFCFLYFAPFCTPLARIPLCVLFQLFVFPFSFPSARVHNNVHVFCCVFPCRISFSFLVLSILGSLLCSLVGFPLRFL